MDYLVFTSQYISESPTIHIKHVLPRHLLDCECVWELKDSLVRYHILRPVETAYVAQLNLLGFRLLYACHRLPSVSLTGVELGLYIYP
jgi:hypothetical protein